MESLKLNVSQLARACVDESYRTALIKDANAPLPNPWVGTHHAPNGNGNLHGAKFHHLASKLVSHLLGLSSTASQPVSSEELWHCLYDRFAKVRLRELAMSDPLGAVNLSTALQAFCTRLADYRKRDTPWSGVLLTDEYGLREVEFAKPAGGKKLLVSGQIDGLRLCPNGTLCLVDYKLTRGAHLERDVVQLALYSRCLALSKHGIRVHGVLEYYEPELHETPVSYDDMETVFRSIVQPVLDELLQLPPTREGQSVVPPTPESAQSSTQEETNEIGRRLQEAFGQFKLGVTIDGALQAPQLIRYRVRPHPGVKIVSLANRAADVQVALGLCQAPRIAPEAGYVSVDIPKAKPDVVRWEQIMQSRAPEDWPSKVAFPIGVSVDGSLLLGDFSDSNMAHALVGGASGSGKSEFLKAMVASLMARNDSQSLRLTLIDPKILTFGALKQSNFLMAPVLTTLEEALDTLEGAAEEMDSRYQRLADEGFENLSQRFGQGLKDLPFWILVFDEYADLILGDGNAKKLFEQLVARIAQKGRAAGIHLVLATQRPDAKVVSPLIKANLPLKVCLKVTSHTNSQIILGEIGGESLLGRGDLLCDMGRGVQRAQAPYLSQEALARVSQATVTTGVSI